MAHRTTAKVRQFIGDETTAQRRRRIWADNLNETLAALGWAPKKFHHELVRAGAEVSIQAVYRWLSGDAAPSADHQLLIATVTKSSHRQMFPIDVKDAA